MTAAKKYTPFLSSALLLCLSLFLVYPNYQYYIDPDGTAYLTIARRYASGDYLRAINGYWSPWSCWLSAILIKAGLMPVPASVVVNATGAIGFLYVTQSLFLRFGIARMLQWSFNFSLVVFLCFAVFWQSFDDLWECFFLLAALRLMLAESFLKRPLLWIALGSMGALAYFAKAYAFPFFILNCICCLFLVAGGDKKKWLKITAVAVTTLIVLSIPWIVALHMKYGIWTTSTAGPLNMSWYLVGHPYWKAGITHLLPPVYSDSPYYWEDPYVVNGETPHFWNTGHLLGMQLLRVGLNLYKLLVSSFQISVFFPLIALAAMFAVSSQKLKFFWTADIRPLTLSFLLFPLGYLLVNYESRYLWYMLPLSMVLAGILLRETENPFKKLLYVLAPLSFIVYPLWGLVKMNHAGYNEYHLAELFEMEQIHGPFTTVVHEGVSAQQLARLAYFSKNSYYNIPDTKLSPRDVIAEMRKYKVKYYLHFYTNESEKNFVLADEQGRPFPEVQLDKAGGIKVFVVSP